MSIKPALTAEEWARAPSTMDFHPMFDQHKIAAVALYGQPFGFTREDVNVLRDAASQLPTFGGGADGNDIPDPELTSLADRIEALLPPESAV